MDSLAARHAESTVVVLVRASPFRHNGNSSPPVGRSCSQTRALGKTILVGLQGGQVSVRGVLHVHSAPLALCPHIEWAVAGALGVPASLPWVDQPAAPGCLRAELLWQSRPGTAGTITSALAGWNMLRFEVTEDASAGCDAVRYSCTPTLGTFSAVTGANGDIMIPEGRLRAAMSLARTGRRRRDRGTAGRARTPASGARRIAGGGARPAARPAVGRRARAVPAGRGGRTGPLAERHRLNAHLPG